MSASREKKLRRELREAEASSDTVKKVKKQKKPMSAAKAKKIRNVVTTVVVIALVAVFALLIFVNSGFLQKNTTAVTVGSHKLSPVEFNYYYQDAYYNLKSSYTNYGMWDYMVDSTKPIEDQTFGLSEDGQTWSEYIQETALNNATQVYTLYDEATAEGFALDDEAKASIDTIAESIATSATQNDFADGNEYLESFYGKGATVDSYVEYVTRQQIASSYSAEKSESFSYSDEELRNYYDENKLDFDTVTFRLFEVATVDDDTAAAKETADAMLAELDGTEKSFSDAALSYATEETKESYEDESYTLRSGYSYSSTSTDYADWLFADSRVAGESQVFTTDTGFAVVMFVSREDNHYNEVNVRHILVKVATSGEDSTSTDEDWAACEEAINAIADEWEDSDKTEETFAALAEEKSEDTGSAADGGLIENVHKGQMVEDFNSWCFEDGRKVGDYGVVKSTYGYHLIYLSGFGDEYWKELADNGKRSDDYDAWFTEAKASYEAKTNSFGMMFTHKKLAA